MLDLTILNFQRNLNMAKVFICPKRSQIKGDTPMEILVILLLILSLSISQDIIITISNLLFSFNLY
jgi:hypothetical protein